MEEKDTKRVITLDDIWQVFIGHIVPVVLAAAIVVALLFVYGEFILVPKYSSTSTLYILRKENSNDYVYTQADFNMALNVVNDCTYMVRSHEVLDEVINKLSIDISYKELYNSVTISNPDNTRILEITVETESAELSKQIVDEICRIASEKINKTMGMDQVNIYSKGTVGFAPSNSIGLTMYALAVVITAVVIYAAYIVAFVLDDKINTEEDVGKYLGLSVIGNIPNSKMPKRKSKKYGYYYSYSNNKQQSGKKKKEGKAK